VCGVNSQEERKKKGLALNFLGGPRLGQGKMSGELEVRKDGDEEKDGGEEGG